MLHALALTVLLAGDKPALPAAEATKFRTAFAEALTDGAKAKKLVAQAEALDGKYALESLLAAELLDLSQPVEVVWNGKTIHAGPVAASFAGAVELALERADWRGAGPARLSLRTAR